MDAYEKGIKVKEALWNTGNTGNMGNMEERPLGNKDQAGQEVVGAQGVDQIEAAMGSNETGCRESLGWLHESSRGEHKPIKHLHEWDPTAAGENCSMHFLSHI